MSITASSLRATSAKKVNFDVIVRDILKTIDADLARASSMWGTSSSVSQIPKTFVEARNVDHEVARNIIYSSVIRNLENRGFDVSIHLLPNQRYATIRTSWEATYSKQKIEEMSRFVGDRTIKPENAPDSTNDDFLNTPI